LPDSGKSADVCLIVEGCYPFVAGGVSSWLDWLMRTQPDLRFSVVAIVSATDCHRTWRYKVPDNLVAFSELVLHRPVAMAPPRLSRLTRGAGEALSEAVGSLIRSGGLSEFVEISRIVNAPERPISIEELMSSRLSLQMASATYRALMPQASFLHFYWAWRALIGGLFATLKFELPPAAVYHTISTGYAGLLAARARIETGRPASITEHGIYTNERRIEILMAEWLTDTVDKGLMLDDERIDLRDMWIKAFEAYARVCYLASDTITTLYGENQTLQTALGASRAKMRVIPNGIDIERFRKVRHAGSGARPTMALIGRVVPIKDVKSFISAAALVKAQIPDVAAIVMGPTDEDKAYYRECVDLVEELGLSDTVTFVGNVKIEDHLGKVHVVVLTSLSEAQPLVLLEAGAAGIPCVTTNVGSCREILLGAADEVPALGAGGIVTDLVAPEQIAAAVSGLLRDDAQRRGMGQTLKARVAASFASDQARASYRALYGELMARPTEAVALSARPAKKSGRNFRFAMGQSPWMGSP
jgi:glycosyltransferase involved in cell wall biosynthesis